ncbi:glycosyltransferase, partial [Acidihalobacter prosperus]
MPNQELEGQHRMRIVHIIPAFAQGGAEEMLLKVIEASRCSGDEHVVIGLKGEGAMRERFSKLCTTFSLGVRGPVPGPWSATRLPLLVRSLAPEMIQGWMYHGNLAATWAWLMQTKRPLLGWSIRQTLYGLSREKFFSRQVIRLNARLASLPHVVIYNSQCSLEQHRDFGLTNDNSVIIPNGFDVTRFRPNPTAGRAFRAEFGIPDSAPVVGMLAR